MDLIDPSYINEEEKYLAQIFLHDNSVKKYILGINKLTRSLLKNISVTGIIDDFTRIQRSRKKDVLNIKDALIVWTATGSPLEVKYTLDTMGFKHISYLALCKYTKLPLAPHPFIMDFKADYTQNYLEYKELYTTLADKKSKETFTQIINFKISFDYNFMQGFTNRNEEQYFDKELIPPLKEIVFLDGGAYIGDTATELIKNYPDFKKLYLIEPISENMRIAKRELQQYKQINFIECGLSSTKRELYFNEEKSFSSMQTKGNHTIYVDTIDNIVTQKVDYIKLDIEGAEQEAIKGARETIIKYKPILAVCIYHKAEDWYKIPKLVLEIYSGYKVYIRHYMEGIFETVMYFIPPQKDY
ncbi:MAG: FkbM family methyltransferase [Campylobacterales bacterium]|nr:FkbM family methyltransferase [Campylobacterales bacterium]